MYFCESALAVHFKIKVRRTRYLQEPLQEVETTSNYTLDTYQRYGAAERSPLKRAEVDLKTREYSYNTRESLTAPTNPVTVGARGIKKKEKIKSRADHGAHMAHKTTSRGREEETNKIRSHGTSRWATARAHRRMSFHAKIR